MSKTHFLSNHQLKSIKDDFPGNSLDSRGRFINLEHLFKPEFKKLLQWQTQTNVHKQEKKCDKFRLKVLKNTDFLSNNNNSIVWLGHASFFMKIMGKSFLIDPIFASPSKFMKRYSELPCNPDEFKNIDYIMISHDHRDHLDIPSLKILIANNPKVKILTGLRIAALLHKYLPRIEMQEAGWYQQYNLLPPNIKITYLPTRHWTRRGITDTNLRLWGAFMFEFEGINIYFGGDSGYSAHFKEVGELFPNIDYAILGIGAYKPEWFMSASHTSPKDALIGALEMKAKNFIPMHYGTFDLADESLGDPYRTLTEIYNPNEHDTKVLFLEIGNSLNL